jgi:hypothetical protein
MGLGVSREAGLAGRSSEKGSAVKRLLVSVAVVAVAALSAPLTAIASAGAGGNRAHAQACHHGGWQTLVREDGSPFANQGACVSYGAQGGTPTPPVADSDGDGVPDASDACPNDGDAGDGVYADGCPKDILAMAYTDVDGNHTFGDGDVLIAKLVDENGNGVSEGDTVTTNRYPLDFAATAFGTFRVTQHTVASVISLNAASVQVRIGDGAQVLFLDDGTEVYQESNPTILLTILDAVDVDFLAVNTEALSRPDTEVLPTVRDSTGDDAFLEVDIR